MSDATGFYHHPASALHDTGPGHPEQSGRIQALVSVVEDRLLGGDGPVERREPSTARVDDIARVHTADHLDLVRSACTRAEENGTVVGIDPDTRVSPDSWEAALGSAGTAIEAARAVGAGELKNAFVATRPPGHHATPTTPMGFCLFNNVALTARWLQAEGAAERVLIVDWDVHHGNGTQDAFYDDPCVYFLSCHQWPHYPGTGAPTERGVGAGEGTTLNVTFDAGTPAGVYRERFEASLEKAASDFDPDFVLVSAGFDCMAGDPLGNLLLEPSDLYAITRSIMDVADGCGGRSVTLLEGGYDPLRLAVGAVSVIRAMAGLPERGA